MAKLKENEKAAVSQEALQQTVSTKTDEFFKKNKKLLWGIVIAVVVIALAILGYQKFIYQPKCAEAMQQTYPAEMNFQAGEYELALNGDGNVLGFAEIIKEYGSKAGKAVYLYAGVCEYQLGNFDAALDYLNKYDGKEPILAARAEACKGDAYVGLEKYQEAIKCFENAAAKADNIFAAGYLFKAGIAYEELGNKAEALRCYKAIEDKYPQSIEAYDIDKYISRVEE